jgi:hypothetical protein
MLAPGQAQVKPPPEKEKCDSGPQSEFKVKRVNRYRDFASY